MTTALWIVQGLLALLFVFAGGMKLLTPIEEMMKQMPPEMPIPRSGFFLRFIGLAELAGGLGLILPGLLRVQPGLTPLAATGLAIIMAGAVALGLAMGDVVPTLIPLVVGLLAAFVAYGRWRLSPLPVSSRRSTPEAGRSRPS
jgi:uncharacterized membrane protein